MNTQAKLEVQQREIIKRSKQNSGSEPSMLVHTYTLSTQEAEAEDSRVPGRPGPQSKFYPSWATQRDLVPKRKGETNKNSGAEAYHESNEKCNKELQQQTNK
jgi:hypothetical protein